MPIRGDYETAVKAVIDWLETRGDIDAGKIGLWGVSLGGYYAPRAAAFEKRVKACIGLSGPYDWATIWDAAAGTYARNVPRALALRTRRRGAQGRRAR